MCEDIYIIYFCYHNKTKNLNKYFWTNIFVLLLPETVVFQYCPLSNGENCLIRSN